MATAQQQQQQQQEALADAALEDLHAAVFAARQVLQALAGPATGEGSAGPPSGAAAAKEEKPAASGRGPAASAAASAAAATTGSTQRGAGVPAAAAAGASGGDQWSVAEAQQVYLARTADLRVKVQQLLELRAAADAAAGELAMWDPGHARDEGRRRGTCLATIRVLGTVSGAARNVGTHERGPARSAGHAKGLPDGWQPVPQCGRLYLSLQTITTLRDGVRWAAGAVKQEPEDAAAVAALQQRKQELISQVRASLRGLP